MIYEACLDTPEQTIVQNKTTDSGSFVYLKATSESSNSIFLFVWENINGVDFWFVNATKK